MKKVILKKIGKAIQKKRLQILVITALFLTLGVFYSYQMVRPVYQVTSKIAIFKDENAIIPEDKIISTYNEILHSEEVIAKVIEETKASKAEIQNQIKLKNVKNTDLFEIELSYSDKETGKDILEKVITPFQEKLNQVYGITEIKQIDTRVIDEAINNHPVRNIIVFGFIGFILSILYAILSIFFDTAIRTDKDIEGLVKIKCIGKIGKYNTRKNTLAKNTMRDFQKIRANIQFLTINKKVKTIYITSTTRGEGKSLVSTYLAKAFAKNGKKVILVDANFYNPVQQDAFKLENVPGLTNYLTGLNEDGSKNNWKLKTFLHKTDIDNLMVLTNGSKVPNILELVVSNKMIDFSKQIKELADIVLVDGSTVESHKDSLVLANLSDASILVTGYKEVKIYQANKAKSAIQNAGSYIIGNILNKVPVNQNKPLKSEKEKEEEKTVLVTVGKKEGKEKKAKEEADVKVKANRKATILSFEDKKKEKTKETEKNSKIEAEKKTTSNRSKAKTTRETKTTSNAATTKKKQESTKKVPAKRGRKKKVDPRTQAMLEQMNKFFNEEEEKKEE